MNLKFALIKLNYVLGNISVFDVLFVEMKNYRAKIFLLL